MHSAVKGFFKLTGTAMTVPIWLLIASENSKQFNLYAVILFIAGSALIIVGAYSKDGPA